MTAVIPVILSGGAGTRLWPLSREMYPKQLLALTSKQTMLQDTAARLATIAGAIPPIVVCNEAHRFTVAEQLRAIEMPASAIVSEVCSSIKAPCVDISSGATHVCRKMGIAERIAITTMVTAKSFPILPPIWFSAKK